MCGRGRDLSEILVYYIPYFLFDCNQLYTYCLPLLVSLFLFYFLQIVIYRWCLWYPWNDKLFPVLSLSSFFCYSFQLQLKSKMFLWKWCWYERDGWKERETDRETRTGRRTTDDRTDHDKSKNSTESATRNISQASVLLHHIKFL